MKFLNFAVLSMLVVGFVNCSSDSSDSSTHSLNSAAYSIITSNTLESTSTQVSGSGSIIFTDPAKNQDHHYTLGFTLEDQGSLLMTTNADSELKNGISVFFSRSGTTLTVKLKNDTQEVDISSKFTSVNASEALSFQIDVHNSENPTHILAWTGVSTFSEENALFNSEEHGNAPGQGTGNLWGLVLTKATVTSASISDAKFEEG